MASVGSNTDRPRVTRQVKLKMVIIAIVPALLLLDTGVAVARGSPLGRVNLTVATFAVLALLAIFLIAVSQRGRWFLQKNGESLAHVCYSALAAWLAAEAIVALFVWYEPVRLGIPSANYHRRQPGTNLIFSPDSSLVPGIEGISHYTTNSQGIRGPEFPRRDSAYRILAIGGSTTENVFLDDTETWPHLVMQRLNQEEERGVVWVGNVGISGFRMVSHLKFVEESPLMEEVDALVFLIGANDFLHFLKSNLGGSELDKNERFQARLEKKISAKKKKSVTPIFQHSPILNVMWRLWNRRMSGRQAEGPSGRHYQVRRINRQESRISVTLPDLERPLQQYETLVRALVQLARGYRLRPIFITQPTLWGDNISERGRALLWLGEITEDEYISAEAGRIGIDKHNEVLLRVCERMGVECINTESMHGQERYFYDGFHFNEPGAIELARLVSKHLLDHAGSNGWDRSP